jgi:succinate-acetate transporter protein
MDESVRSIIEPRATEPTGPGAGALPIVAEPAAVGLAALGLATVVWGVANGDLIPARASLVVIPVALFYGGLVALLAGMWEFRRGNTFGALAFSSYGGGFWLPYALIAMLVLPGLHGLVRHEGLAIFYVVWAVFSLFLLLAALRTTAVAAGFVLFFFASLSVLASGLYVGNNAELLKIGGYVAIFAGGIAWYGAAAAVSNATRRRVILPVFPL